jgi:deoxyribodipyrimidine photo-lyase
MKKDESFGVHWFRRDLRVFGNAALRANFRRNQGRVLGFFCFDSQFLSRSDFSANRFAFFLKTLQALKQELQSQGGDLLIVDALPRDAFPKLIEFFENKTDLGKPSLLSWSRDYEPFARKRDAEIASLLDRHGVEFITERDHLILEPTEILKSEKPGDFYQVYSPYSRKWFAAFSRPDIQGRIQAQAGLEKYVQGMLYSSMAVVFGASRISFS